MAVTVDQSGVFGTLIDRTGPAVDDAVVFTTGAQGVSKHGAVAISRGAEGKPALLKPWLREMVRYKAIVKGNSAAVPKNRFSASIRTQA